MQSKKRGWGSPPRAGSTTESTLRTFIEGEIRANNCLGLTDDEVSGMVAEMVQVKTREEVMEWGQTLMLGDDFAKAVIQRRVESGPPFEGEAAPTPTAPAAVSLRITKRGGAAKRKAVPVGRMGPQSDAEGAALKPGHFECGCFATVHALRGNCQNCGRIICQQEADDECYFCGMVPKTCAAYEIAMMEGKVSEAARTKNQGLYEEAVARRDQLLEFAQNRAKRTTVVDDQSLTLFAPQSAWITPQERQAQQKAAAQVERDRRVELLHKNRGAYQVHLDFVGQNMKLGARPADAGGLDAPTAATQADDAVAEEEECEEHDEVLVEDGAQPLPSLLQKIWYSPQGEAGEGSCAAEPVERAPRAAAEVSRRVQQDYYAEDCDAFAEEVKATQHLELVFDPQQVYRTQHVEPGDDEDAREDNDTQVGPMNWIPTGVMRNNDDGICLSMHQPWASLLVAGIKTHEGRVWSTPYRGKLWIHAAAAEAVDVAQTEQHYSQFVPPYGSFPKHYPTRVLLGYVYVVDCLDQETYQRVVPAEKRQLDNSPFIFICAEPTLLPFPLPMSGNHKLFHLEHKVHTAARKQLQELAA